MESRRDYEQIPTERELAELLDRVNSRTWVTGMISVTPRSKRTWGSSIMPSGCARSVRVRLAVMCKTASGPREIVNRLLPEASILKNLFRSFLQTAYLSGR